MVVAATGQDDRSLREAMEVNAVSELRKMGYNATSAFMEYGPESFDTKDEAAVVDRMTGSGVDAVLTIVLLDVSQEKTYVPGHVAYSPYGYYDQFWGYYTTVYNRIYTPGYYTVDHRYFWETNVYNMSNRELIYSVQSESFDPSSASDLGEDYAELIVKDMIRNNVLTKK
ncbi:MAG: hypothetical protein K0R82_2955, partial [Flavipsychrobacter sp.]|nr:hypothetical protein [Flavipsychrobacter sp.]